MFKKIKKSAIFWFLNFKNLKNFKIFYIFYIFQSFSTSSNSIKKIMQQIVNFFFKFYANYAKIRNQWREILAKFSWLRISVKFSIFLLRRKSKRNIFHQTFFDFSFFWHNKNQLSFFCLIYTLFTCLIYTYCCLIYTFSHQNSN